MPDRLTPERLEEIRAGKGVVIVSDLLAEIDALRATISGVHHAIGESEHSDDATLPGVVVAIVKDYAAEIDALRRERDALAGENGRLRQQLAAAESREAELREALRQIAHHESYKMGPTSRAYEIAAPALSAPSPRAEALLRVVEAAGANAYPHPGDSPAYMDVCTSWWHNLKAALAAYREAR